ADAVSRQLADADRREASEQRQHQYGDHCRRNRLRIGGGFQPRLQEDGGGAALGLASPSCRRCAAPADRQLIFGRSWTPKAGTLKAGEQILSPTRQGAASRYFRAARAP